MAQSSPAAGGTPTYEPPSETPVTGSVRLEQRVTAVARAILLAALVAAPWAYGSAGDVARFALSAALLAGATTWWAGRAIGGSPLPRLAVPAAGLPVFALLQAATGRSAAPVWTVEAAIVLAAMLGPLVFWSERARSRREATLLAGAVLAVCAAQAVFGAVQWSRAADRIYGQVSPIMTTPFGSYVNHNHFAGLIEMGALLAAGMALGHAARAGGPTAASVGLGGLGLGLVAAHLASRSRGGLVALVGGLALLGLLWPQTSSSPAGGRRRLLTAIAAAAALIAFGWLAVPSATRAHLATLVRGSSDPSGIYRLDLAGGTLRLAAARPLLGSGLGAYADAFPPFKPGHGDVRSTHAESDVLEFVSEVGLVGLLLAFWLAWAIVAGFWDRITQGRDPYRKGLAVGALAAAGAVVLHSLLDFNLRIPANALVFASLLGLAAAPRTDPRPGTSRAAHTLAAIVCLVMTVAAAWRAHGAWMQDRALAGPGGDARIAALDRALAVHPYLAEAYRARGVARRELAWQRPGAAQVQRAAQDLERAVALRPGWGEAWADLGWARYLAGETAESRDAMARAARLDPTHVGLAVSHAELLARVEGADAAIAELGRARELNPWWTLDNAVAVARRWTRDPSRFGALTDGSPAETDRLQEMLKD